MSVVLIIIMAVLIGGLLVYLFLGGDLPTCLDAADANDDGQLSISDPIYTLDLIFGAAKAPSPPYPGCGGAPTEDSLSCFGLGSCS